MELDIIYVIPVVIVVGIIWLVYRLGIEVGRVMQQNEDRARRAGARQRAAVRSNVTPLFDTTRATDSKEQSWHE
jgi:hypothetical protein